MLVNSSFDETVKRQNNHVPRGRGRYRDRYRRLIGGLFDPDTDPDPGTDKAGMGLLVISSSFDAEGTELP